MRLRWPASVRRAVMVPMVCLMVLALSGALIAYASLHRGHDSVGFRCGLLPTAGDQYLDGSGRLFQSCNWHLGNGTRTWGETYGVKVSRVYLSMEVRHTNPRITAEEARENE